MIDDEQFTDFKLKCNDGEVLTCHKFMLVARSPVIYQMLSTDLKEDQKGLAEVPDFDSAVMKQVLRFLYCDKIENLDQISYRLIFAAEKYQLKELTQMCIQNIIENLTFQNVIDSLIVSGRVTGFDSFFTECADFILK